MRACPPCLALLVVLAHGCDQDLSFSESARCDGVLQPGEDTVDSAFDRDGDGYFDANNPDCAATYDAEDLDCDDTDADVHPGAAEECGDDIDNDCDGESDDVCSYSGTWGIEPAISYTCAYSLVNMSFNSLQVFDSAPSISFGASGAQPGTMLGNIDTEARFTVVNTLSGECTETYTLTGQFDSTDAFSGSFTASFAGAFCFDCQEQAWPVTGTRF